MQQYPARFPLGPTGYPVGMAPSRMGDYWGGSAIESGLGYTFAMGFPGSATVARLTAEKMRRDALERECAFDVHAVRAAESDL